MAHSRSATKTKITKGRIDWLFLSLALGLCFFGLIMVYDTSVVLAHEIFGDEYWFVKNQALWLGVGLVFMVIAARVDYHFWQKISRGLIYATFLLLLLVLLPGFSNEILGAKRRLAFPVNLPFLSHINVQPSEIAKLTGVIFVAGWMAADPETKKKDKKLLQQQKKFGRGAREALSRLSRLIVLMVALDTLIMLEPDLGMALIISGALTVVYFLGGAPWPDILALLLLLPSFGLAFSLSSAYRRARLLTFLNPETDPLGISYHLRQLLIALGSGGFLGLGLGQSRQKYQYLPEPATDSVFAILGEELGFVGAALVLLALLALIWRGFNLAEKAPDKLGWLLGTGIVSLVAIQVVVNLGSTMGLLPITGVPLPFISYGGSSLTILLFGVGILLNVSRS